MINPYEILEVDQDAPMPEIIRAMQKAMMKKQYPMPVLTTARVQLSTPERRLAADFTFLVSDDPGSLDPIPVPEIESADISTFKLDKYDSL